jgi:hypothetical protein
MNIDLVKAVVDLRFPHKIDRRMHKLMDRNTNGNLTKEEQDELEGLVELSETMGLLRANALHLLEKNQHDAKGPPCP